MPRQPRSTLEAVALRTRLEDFCRVRDLDALYVFGSRAEELCRSLEADRLAPGGSSSDVDIGILPAESVVLPVDRKVAIAAGLEDLLGVSRVDLVVLPEADPFLAVNVIRGERLFFRDVRCTDEYELFVLRRAGDLAPFERERLAMIGRA
jgi:predicted nucleotidyltransferase